MGRALRFAGFLGGVVGLWLPSVAAGQVAGEGGSADTLVISLAEAEAMALRHHPQVQLARGDVLLSESRRAQASHARFLPKLELRNVWGPVPRARGEFTETGVLVSPDTSTSLSDLRLFTQVNFELLQPIYTFGKLGGLLDAAESGVEASRYGEEAAREDVRLQVRKLYWGLILGEELVRVADDVRSRFEEAEETLDARFEEGEASQNDVFKFRIFRYEILRRQREAEDRLALAEVALRLAVGISGDVPLRTEARELSAVAARLENLDHYVELALASRPELGQLEAGIAARSSLVRSRRATYLPQLFVGAEVAWNRASDRFDPKNPFVYNPTNFFRPGVVLGFNWNANLFQTRDAVRVAEYEEAKLRSGLDPLRAKVRLEVSEAYLKAVRALADLQDSERALKASDNWSRAEAQTFDLGLGEVKDLVDAFRANSEMRVEHLRNVFDFNTAVAELSRAVGRGIEVEADS